MSLGVWETMFADIVEHYDETAREPKQRVLELIGEHLGDDGTLSRRQVAAIAEHTGWGVRSIRRFQHQLVTGAPVSTKRSEPTTRPGTFIDWVQADGPAGFQFDELALSMVYANGGNRSRFRREVMAEGLPMPSEATLSRLWQALPAAIRDGASSGHRNRYRNMLIVRRQHSTVANERWQLDDFDLDLRVLVDPRTTLVAPDDVQIAVTKSGAWIGRRPHLTLLIDEASRFITGWMLLDHAPTAADVTCLFADAFEVRRADYGPGLIGGRCSTLVCDNAKAFTALATERMFLANAVTVAPAPAYSPISKGIVERNGATVQEMIVAGLAGVVRTAERRDGSALFDNRSEHWLEFEQLERHVASVILDYNYRRPHGGLTGKWRGKTPAQAYTSLNKAPRPVADEQLAAMHLPVRYKSGLRTVDPSGVFVFGEHWVAPELDTWRGKEVEVRCLHHRIDRLAVLTPKGDFLCFVEPSTEVDTSVAGQLVDARMVTEQTLNRIAARARSAVEIRTADIAAGGDGSTVKAAVEAFARRDAEKRAVTPKRVPKAPVAPPSAVPPSVGKSVTGKAGSGKKPASKRPPKQGKVSKAVPAATAATKPTGLDVAEQAALAQLAARSKRNAQAGRT